GSPMPEVLNNCSDSINGSNILTELKLEKDKYILVSAHREENIDIEENFMDLVNSLNSVAEEFKIPIIYSTHPRSWKKIEEKKIKFNPLIKKLKPFGFIDYNKLQQNAFCVLSDSGTLSEESAILNFPAVLIRTSTERPEVLDKGSIIIGGIKSGEVIQAVYSEVEMFEVMDNTNILPVDYQDADISMKVAKIIQSYTKIVNKNIWRKN
ncbi:MAG: UDP-N-acetylglucosamine 2-epimerase, partial [Promethearchaeota archaeon]